MKRERGDKIAIFFIFFSDQMDNKGAFITLTKNLIPRFTTFSAVVSVVASLTGGGREGRREGRGGREGRREGRGGEGREGGMGGKEGGEGGRREGRREGREGGKKGGEGWGGKEGGEGGREGGKRWLAIKHSKNQALDQ